MSYKAALLGLGGAGLGGAYLHHQHSEDSSLSDSLRVGGAMGISAAGLGYAGYAASQVPGLAKGLGAVGKTGWNVAKSVKVFRPKSTFVPGKGKLFAAVASIAAVAAGSAMSPKGVEMAGVETEDGSVDYVSPQEAHAGDVKRHMRNMNTHGDMVFGMHAKRR